MSSGKKRILALALSLAIALSVSVCASALEPGTSITRTVTVSDVDGFLDAIAPDTEIHLAPGTYNLTEASSYGKENSSRFYRWNNYGYYDGFELVIENAHNLSIIGDSAEILTEPRYANVLSFADCDNLTLSGLQAGHTVATEACEGGVIELRFCNSTVIDGCSLYGCGTTGVYAGDCDRLSVKNTDIHHCSSVGLFYYNGHGLYMENCRVFSCGSPEFYGAVSAFMLNGAKDVNVKGCEVSDCFMSSLVYSFGTENAAFSDINISGNHFSSVFDCSSPCYFSRLSFSDNILDRWTGYDSSGCIIVDGNTFTEDDCNAAWEGQLSSAGLGAVKVSYRTIDRAGAREVHVSTADEFLSAIASDTTVCIDVPRIDLTESSNYGEGASQEYWAPQFGAGAYAWAACYDGFELCIGNVSNFHITGGEIVTQPRYANVLNYYYCSDVTLENVRLGHTPEQGSCCGGVLHLVGTDSIIIEGCDLYGCGVLGIDTEDVKDLHVQNTLIHDCSYGAGYLQDTDGATFLGCSIVNCPDPHFTLQACTGFSWDSTLMDPYSSFNVA